MYRTAIVKCSDRVDMDLDHIEIDRGGGTQEFGGHLVRHCRCRVGYAACRRACGCRLDVCAVGAARMPKQEETFSSLMTLLRTRMATPGDDPGAVGAVFKRCKPVCLHDFRLANRNNVSVHFGESWRIETASSYSRRTTSGRPGSPSELRREEGPIFDRGPGSPADRNSGKSWFGSCEPRRNRLSEGTLSQDAFRIRADCAVRFLDQG